jgi:hypothetical protein
VSRIDRQQSAPTKLEQGRTDGLARRSGQIRELGVRDLDPERDSLGGLLAALRGDVELVGGEVRRTRPKARRASATARIGNERERSMAVM